MSNTRPHSANEDLQVRLCVCVRVCLWIMRWRSLRASHPPAVVCICSKTQCVRVCVCVLISHAVHPAAESARVFYFSTQTLNDDMNALSLFVNAYMMLTESVNMINIFRDCVFMLVIHS